MKKEKELGSDPRAILRAFTIVLIAVLVALVPTSRGTDGGGGGCPGLNCPSDSSGPETTIVIVDTQSSPDLFGIISIVAGMFF